MKMIHASHVKTVTEYMKGETVAHSLDVKHVHDSVHRDTSSDMLACVSLMYVLEIEYM